MSKQSIDIFLEDLDLVDILQRQSNREIIEVIRTVEYLLVSFFSHISLIILLPPQLLLSGVRL